MKIYFTSSNYVSTLNALPHHIINYLKKSGHDVYTITAHENNFSTFSEHQIKARFKEWIAYVNECDCIVIEGSYPSNVHIGFEVGLLAGRGKPIIVLYKRGFDPVFINAHYSKRLIKSEYTKTSLFDTIDWCIEEVARIINRRFTFFIPPELDSFLEIASQERGISRSEYIRMLIENEMNHQ